MRKGRWMMRRHAEHPSEDIEDREHADGGSRRVYYDQVM
jgi:hypothetical protein